MVVLVARRQQFGVGLRHCDAGPEYSGHLKEEVHVDACRLKLKWPKGIYWSNVVFD